MATTNRQIQLASLPTGNYWLATTGKGEDPEPDKGPGEYVGSNGFGFGGTNACLLFGAAS